LIIFIEKVVFVVNFLLYIIVEVAGISIRINCYLIPISIIIKYYLHLTHLYSTLNRVLTNI